MIALNNSEEYESTSHLYFISTLNERFAKNQAQSSECMINSSIDDFPDDFFTSKYWVLQQPHHLIHNLMSS